MKKYAFLFWAWMACCGAAAQDEPNDSVQAEGSVAMASEVSLADAAALKLQADSAYMAEDYVRAIELYLKALGDQGESAVVYYNLGNSYYKTDHIAQSILYLERAALLSPGDDDIRYNLQIAKGKAVDKEADMTEMFFVTWARQLVASANERGWARMGIACFIIVLLSLSAYFFCKRMAYRKVGFAVAVVALLACVVCNVCASVQKDRYLHRNHAIVMSPSITVRSTPSNNGTELFVLHEGRKVSIKDNTMDAWKEIQLEDGNAGWVPADAIEVI